MMGRIHLYTEQKDGGDVMKMNPPPQSSVSSFPTPSYASNFEKQSNPSSPLSRISPVVLLLIIILAVIFFIYGLLHLFVRMLKKRPSFNPIYQSNRYTETSASDALQRQLQQLFKLHDSGVDQAFIDALPVFYYQDIMGLKEPFDCAVCLSEFCDQDELRLLPKCSHAFHINCIDTWLLSNSTCPLCRGSLLSSGLSTMETSILELNHIRQPSSSFPSEVENGHGLSSGQKPERVEQIVNEKRVLSVRLGKFRSLNNEQEHGETSSSNLDARRCYSMGAFQYVVVDSDLQVALNPKTCRIRNNDESESIQRSNESLVGDEQVEGKKITGRRQGESLSVSKIWLWSKNTKFPSSSDAHLDMHSLVLSHNPSRNTTINTRTGS